MNDHGKEEKKEELLKEKKVENKIKIRKAEDYVGENGLNKQKEEREGRRGTEESTG